MKDKRIYAIIGGPEPGIAIGWAEGRRRTHGHEGAYPKKLQTLEEARAYYEEMTGQPAPPVPRQDTPVPKPTPHRRIRIETEHGVIEITDPRPEQVEGLQALALWP